MASVSSARSRIALIGLAMAGALVGTTGGAAAQYYYDDDYDYAPRSGYYGYGYRYAPPPAPLSARAVARIAIREYGLAQVERTVRTGSSYVVDGQAANGRRTRLIFDLYSGDLVQRVNLQAPERERVRPRAPEVARIEPDARPAQPRLLPLPPERPASLKGPAQASAPAQVIPPSPAAPPAAPEPEKPAVPPPPVEASAPATEAPASPAAPAAPTPGPTAPSGEEKPRLVNPNDVRGTEEPDRQPPLAKASPSGISVAPVELPPIQIPDAAPSAPKPETPAVPVAPLE